jgi:hypothetical protein
MEDSDIIRMIDKEIMRRQQCETNFLRELHKAGVTSGRLHMIASQSSKVHEPDMVHLANALRDIERMTREVKS